MSVNLNLYGHVFFFFLHELTVQLYHRNKDEIIHLKRAHGGNKGKLYLSEQTHTHTQTQTGDLGHSSMRLSYG